MEVQKRVHVVIGWQSLGRDGILQVQVGRGKNRSSDLFRAAEGPEKAGGAKLKRCASLFKGKERQIDWGKGACTRERMRRSVRAIELEFSQGTDSDISRQRRVIIRIGLGRRLNTAVQRGRERERDGGE